MVKRGKCRSFVSERNASTAARQDASKTATAAEMPRPSRPHSSPSSGALAAASAASEGRERREPPRSVGAMDAAQAEDKREKQAKKKKKKKSKRNRQDDSTSANSSRDAIGGILDHSDDTTQQESPRSSSSPAAPASKVAAAPAPAQPPRKKAKRKRVKTKPARFVHPQLDAELRRLRRPWLSPGDPLFESALERSYQGMRHLPADSLPPAVHTGFRQAFDGLHDAGLFLYDTVQAGGKRLSRTFVTRTLVGDPGITYKYLGLRLFAHPWDEGTSDFRTGPGDGLADSLRDPCLSDLFPADGASGGGGGGGSGGTGRAKHGSRNGTHGLKATPKTTADTLRKVGDLSEWMRLRAAALLKEGEGEGGGPGGDAEGGETGSCAFNLTLINRMECSSAKRDLKPDPLFAMGKCSVSWHADSCLQDFSTIGVYHCTEPVPVKPDWGIALRVSQEAEGGGGGDGGKGGGGGGDKAQMSADAKARRMEPGAATAAGAVPEPQEKEVLTPPLLVPLESGDAYFLLDDFNHFHEHAVVSGSSTLRYSSTHRVADTDGNTFSHVQDRCEEVLAGGGGVPAAEPRRILDLAQVRAEQALLTELESEWLNQFWVQGRRHATLHPWWRGPMALVLATWRELERRTALTVQRLMSLRDEEGYGDADGGGGSGVAAEPATIAKAFETVLRALEERRESRSRWAARFADPAYRSLSDDCSPVIPALWPAEGSRGGGAGEKGGASGEGALLPQSLAGVISRLRECYTLVYRAASGGKKAGSAKAIAAGAASNWELFRAASSRPSSGGGKPKGAQTKQPERKQGKQANANKGGRGLNKKRAAGGVRGGGEDGGSGGGGRRKKKGSLR